jgi:hypothetical protein
VEVEDVAAAVEAAVGEVVAAAAAVDVEKQGRAGEGPVPGLVLHVVFTICS